MGGFDALEYFVGKRANRAAALPEEIRMRAPSDVLEGRIDRLEFRIAREP
jgi:hypothetical protein